MQNAFEYEVDVTVRCLDSSTSGGNVSAAIRSAFVPGRYLVDRRRDGTEFVVSLAVEATEPEEAGRRAAEQIEGALRRAGLAGGSATLSDVEIRSQEPLDR